MESPELTRTPLDPWSPRQRVGLSIFWLFLLASGLCSLWWAGAYVGAQETVHVGGTVFIFAVLLAGTYLGLYGLLGTVRRGLWLRGSVLSVRGAGPTRSVDLAAATVRGEINDAGRGRPLVMLVARDTVTGRRVSLRLGTVDRIEFTPQELDALADAIDTARSGPVEDEETLRIAGRLRQFYRRRYPVGRYLWTDPPPG